MRLIATLVIVTLLAVSCKKETANNVDIVVKVGDITLSYEELQSNMPSYTNSQDSVLMAEYYIRTWINEVLLYEVAKKNISSRNNIEQLVENYRKSLIIHRYQEELVNQRLLQDIDDKEVRGFFEANKAQFKLEYSLIKGVFLRIPVSAPQIDKVRLWMKTITPSSIDHIEKYSILNASSYDYFVDDWVNFNELINNWPVDYKNSSDIIKKNAFLEQKDDKYYYFLNITDFLLTGQSAPYEYAEPTVREILINQKKIDFLHTLEEGLYDKAVKNGQIVLYKE